MIAGWNEREEASSPRRDWPKWPRRAYRPTGAAGRSLFFRWLGLKHPPTRAKPIVVLRWVCRRRVTHSSRLAPSAIRRHRHRAPAPVVLTALARSRTLHGERLAAGTGPPTDAVQCGRGRVRSAA